MVTLGKRAMGFNIINISLVGSKNAPDRGNVNNVNSVKSIAGSQQESPFGFNIVDISPVRSIFSAERKLTLCMVAVINHVEYSLEVFIE